MTLCPACSKPLALPDLPRCPACGAIRRVGDTPLPPAATLHLAAEVARTGLPWDAYAFVLQNFPRVRVRAYRQGRARRTGGIDAAALCHGYLEFARETFGPRAAEFLESLRLRRSEDIGNVVFGLAAARLLKIEEGDRLEDFDDPLDL